jgi:8-oxo-dGTP diphosphatase
MELHRTATVFLAYEYPVKIPGVGTDWQYDVLLVFHPKYSHWMAPGGHVEPGELTHEAAIREIKEETGLDVSFPTTTLTNRSTVLPRPFAIMRYEDETKSRVDEDALYLLAVDRATREMVLQPEPGAELKWVSLSQLDQYDLYLDTKSHLRNLPFYIQQQEETQCLTWLNPVKV